MIPVSLTLLLFLSSAGRGGPELGPVAEFFTMEGRGNVERTLSFRGGVRACVFAKGAVVKGGTEDGRPVMMGNDAAGFLRIDVFDASGTLITSSPDTDGYAAVFWYPPRTAEYKVQVHNRAGQEKSVYVCIK